MRFILIFCIIISSCTTTRYRTNNAKFRFDGPKSGEQFVRKESIVIEENYYGFGASSGQEVRNLDDFISLGENEALCNIEIKNQMDAGDFWSMFGLSLITAGIGSPIVWTTRTTTITGDVVAPK